MISTIPFDEDDAVLRRNIHSSSSSSSLGSIETGGDQIDLVVVVVRLFRSSQTEQKHVSIGAPFMGLGECQGERSDVMTWDVFVSRDACHVKDDSKWLVANLCK